jgi:predicted anti-sigma-YlaC factor YlaD
MACAKGNKIIHDWLDQPHSGSAPEEVAAHLRECSECRTFVQRWNAIELGIQAARRNVPPLTHDLNRAVWTRIRMGRRRVTLAAFRRRALVAVAMGAAVIAAIALALMSLHLADSASHPASSALAVMRSAPAPHTPEDAAPQGPIPADAR